MKKLFKFLSLALCTICLTMTAVFAIEPFPKYEKPEQFMDPEFALAFAVKLRKYNWDQCNREENGVIKTRFCKVKRRIEELMLDLEGKNPKAALRLAVAIGHTFTCEGVRVDVSKSESFSAYKIFESTKETDPHRPLYLKLYRKRGGEDKPVAIASINYEP